MLAARRAATALLLLLVFELPGGIASALADESKPSAGSLLAPPATDRQRTTYLPILVYHHIRQRSPMDSRALRRLTVTPEIFQQQMQYLQDNGYHIVSFSSLENFFERGGELPTRPVIISFDDGWESQFQVAVPILEKYQFTATFFVIANYVGCRGFLSVDELRAMVGRGMSIGSHSRSHPHLENITDAKRLWGEIYGSKAVLESELGVPVTEFAYPYGSYNAAAVNMVMLAGYKAARAANFGSLHSADEIYRLSAIMAPVDVTTFAKSFLPNSGQPKQTLAAVRGCRTGHT
jgi:peptidoglycan/xylan/chitin deacetylase (PgdA/CDA1 family)